jgi:uncharacterized protein with HEPN domain
MRGRDWRFRLRDMLDHAERVSSYVHDITYEAFADDRLRVDAVLYNLEIVGEAARHVLETVRARYPDVPWREVAGMRNRIAHGYTSVNLAIVWATATLSVPQLVEVLRRHVADLDG